MVSKHQHVLQYVIATIIFAAITGCYWIEWLFNFRCYWLLFLRTVDGSCRPTAFSRV